MSVQALMLCELDLSFCAALVHLDFLEGCSALTRINLACCAKLQCIAGLAHCPELTSLGMWGAEKVTSLEPVCNCRNLLLLDCTAMPELRPRSALSVVTACQKIIQAHFDARVATFIQSRLADEVETSHAEEVTTVFNGLRAASRRQRRLANGNCASRHGTRITTEASADNPPPVSRRRRKSLVSCICGARDENSTVGYTTEGPVPGVS